MTASAKRLFIAALFAVYVVIYIIPIGLRPLIMPYEYRYAEIPREMIQTGDWLVPHLDGVRYFEKPPLGYWLNAISIKVFGETPFAVRLPSALAAGLSAWFIWLLMIRTGYGDRLSLAAAAVYLVFVETLFVGTTALLDTPFTMFVTGGIVLFYLASTDTETARTRRLYQIGSGIMFGLAFLTKGFLAFAIPGLVLLPHIVFGKQETLLLRSWPVALSCLAVILPWAVMIHLRESDFWHYFIWEEHIRRFLAEDAQHPEPWYFFVALFPVVALPWTAFLPAATSGLRRARIRPEFARFLVLWFALPFLLFSLSAGKIVTYILPCFAPAAALVAMGIFAYLKSGRSRLFRLGVGVNIVLVAVVLVLLLFPQLTLSRAEPFYPPGELAAQVLLVALASLGMLLMVLAAVFRAPLSKLGFVALSVVPIFLAVNLALPTWVFDNKSPSAFFGQIAKQMSADTILISDLRVVRAVTWTFKRDDIYLLGEGELAYGLRYPEHASMLLDEAAFQSLLDRQRAGSIDEDIAILCKRSCPRNFAELLPPEAEQHGNGHYTIWLVRP